MRMFILVALVSMLGCAPIERVDSARQADALTPTIVELSNGPAAADGPTINHCGSWPNNVGWYYPAPADPAGLRQIAMAIPSPSFYPTSATLTLYYTAKALTLGTKPYIGTVAGKALTLAPFAVAGPGQYDMSLASNWCSITFANQSGLAPGFSDDPTVTTSWKTVVSNTGETSEAIDFSGLAQGWYAGTTPNTGVRVGLNDPWHFTQFDGAASVVTYLP